MTGLADINYWIEKNLFAVIPMSAAVIDRDFNLVIANRAFEQMFGPWQDQKCYKVYKNRESMCSYCKGAEAFKDGKPRINRETGYDKQGKLTQYIKHTIPIKDADGSIPFLIEMATDITETEQLRQEYQLLFEQVPCVVLIIGRDFKIVRTNKRARDMFGAIEGAYCYQILKGHQDKCIDCTAYRTFEDGLMHTGHSTVQDKEKQKVEFLVTTVPFQVEDGKFDLVLEMGVDITRTLELQDELKITASFMKSMISASLIGTIAVDENENITIFNDAALRIFNIRDKEQVKNEDLVKMFPQGFLETVSSSSGAVYIHETQMENSNGESFPARLTGINLKIENQDMGKAFWVQDLREIKKLEAEKLEAERLAAVGQTVAGLAHGIKNVLTGLEGGIYMLNSGLRKGDAARCQKGMEMLNRNTKKVSTFVKEFLNFSKGQEVEAQLCNPVEIAKEVVDLYSVQIKQLGIGLKSEHDNSIAPAALDSEGIHECLANLVGNAIDACRLSDNISNSLVKVSTFEKDDTIIYEVMDNGCGMEYEVKKRVFTTFFTTKGLGGTGLGLLMTKKIVQQHGGKVEFESNPGGGTTFRISLPRKRLPKLIHQEKGNEPNLKKIR